MSAARVQSQNGRRGGSVGGGKRQRVVYPHPPAPTFDAPTMATPAAASAAAAAAPAMGAHAPAHAFPHPHPSAVALHVHAAAFSAPPRISMCAPPPIQPVMAQLVHPTAALPLALTATTLPPLPHMMHSASMQPRVHTAYAAAALLSPPPGATPLPQAAAAAAAARPAQRALAAIQMAVPLPAAQCQPRNWQTAERRAPGASAAAYADSSSQSDSDSSNSDYGDELKDGEDAGLALALADSERSAAPAPMASPPAARFVPSSPAEAWRVAKRNRQLAMAAAVASAASAANAAACAAGESASSSKAPHANGNSKAPTANSAKAPAVDGNGQSSSSSGAVSRSRPPASSSRNPFAPSNLARSADGRVFLCPWRATGCRFTMAINSYPRMLGHISSHSKGARDDAGNKIEGWTQNFPRLNRQLNISPTPRRRKSTTVLAASAAAASAASLLHYASALSVPLSPLSPSSLKVQSDDTAICCICEDGESVDENPILLCDGLCSLAYHQLCLTAEAKPIPEGDWFCSAECEAGVVASMVSTMTVAGGSRDEPIAIDEHKHADAADASAAAAAAQFAPPTQQQMSDAQLTAHIQRKRQERQARLVAHRALNQAARIARISQKQQHDGEGGGSAAAASGSPAELSLSQVRSGEEFWLSLAPFFDPARLFNAQKLLHSSTFDAGIRYVPELGQYWKSVWLEEDDEADVSTPRHMRSYVRPARGTERHDEVEFEHYYEERNLLSPVANAMGSAAAAVAALPASAAAAAAAAAASTPRSPDEHKQRTRPERYESKEDAEMDCSDTPPPPSSSSAAAAAGAPNVAIAAPPLIKLRSRHQSTVMRRVAQAPIRLTMHAQFVPKSAMTDGAAPVSAAASTISAAASASPTAVAAAAAGPVAPDAAATPMAMHEPAASPAAPSTVNPSASSPPDDEVFVTDFFVELRRSLTHPEEFPPGMPAYMMQVQQSIARAENPPPPPSSVRGWIAAAYSKWREQPDKQLKVSFRSLTTDTASQSASPATPADSAAAAASSSQRPVSNVCCDMDSSADCPASSSASASSAAAAEASPVCASASVVIDAASVASTHGAGKGKKGSEQHNRTIHPAAACSSSSLPCASEGADTDALLPALVAPPPPYFILRAFDLHYARECGVIDIDMDPLQPSSAYRFDNQLLHQYLLSDAGRAAVSGSSGSGGGANGSSKVSAPKRNPAEAFTSVEGPFAGHYTFPVLYDTSSCEARDPDSHDALFALQPSLFDYEFRTSRQVKVQAHDNLAMRRRSGVVQSPDDLAFVDPDEVSSTLWLLRRELLNQININHDRRKALRQACAAEHAFDKTVQQQRQAAIDEQQRVLALYREKFPSQYATAQEYEQEQAALAIHSAAHRAGKSISMAQSGSSSSGGGGGGGSSGGGHGTPTRPSRSLAHLTAEEREAHQRRLKREASQRYNESRKLKRIALAAERAKQDEREDAQAEGESEQDDDEDSEADGRCATPRRKHPHGPARSPATPPQVQRAMVAGKAPRSSAAPVPGAGGNVIVIPRPKLSQAAAKQQHDLVRQCVEQLVSMVEQIDRSQSVVKSKSKKISQLRERREKRQSDMNEWEEQRNNADQCSMVIGAIVSQIELNTLTEAQHARDAIEAAAAEEADPAAASAAAAAPEAVPESVAASAAPVPMDMDIDNDEAAAAAAAPPPDSAAAPVSPARAPEGGEAAAGTREESKDADSIMADAATADASALHPSDTAAAAASSSDAATSPAAAAASNSDPFTPPYTYSPLPHPLPLPAAHLYVERGYCPRENRPYSINVPYMRCDHCGEWWHTRCMGFTTPEDLVRVYRAYCKICQERGYLNQTIAQGSRRKRTAKQHEGVLPVWSSSGGLSDAAVSRFVDGMDDAERLEKEEEDEEKQLIFLYLAEKHQQTLLVDGDGNELRVTTSSRKVKKARAPDADELAVLSDPDPWEWMKVRMHRLGSYRLRLHKTCTTRRGDTRFEILKPVIVRETFFPMTEEGTKQYDWAKLQLSIPTYIKRKIENRRSFFAVTISGGKPRNRPAAAAAAAPARPVVLYKCDPCGISYKAQSALNNHVRWKHTLWSPEGVPSYSAKVLDNAPRWRSSKAAGGDRSRARRPKQQQEEGSATSASDGESGDGEEGEEEEEEEEEQNASDQDEDDDAAGCFDTESEADGGVVKEEGEMSDEYGDGTESVTTAAAAVPAYRRLPTSPSKIARTVSRSGRNVQRLVLQSTPRSTRKRQRSEGAADADADADEDDSTPLHLLVEEGEIVPPSPNLLSRLRKQQAATRAIRQHRQQEQTSRVMAKRAGNRRAAAAAPKPLPPLPEFERSDAAMVVARRANERSKRLKFQLRILKPQLPPEVRQQLVELKAATVAARASSDGAVAVAPRRPPPESSSSDSSDDDSVVHSPGCSMCGGMENPRETLICDGCEGEVHLYCTKPRLRAVPRGKYYCPLCKEKDAAPKQEAQAPPVVVKVQLLSRSRTRAASVAASVAASASPTDAAMAEPAVKMEPGTAANSGVTAAATTFEATPSAAVAAAATAASPTAAAAAASSPATAAPAASSRRRSGAAGSSASTATPAARARPQTQTRKRKRESESDRPAEVPGLTEAVRVRITFNPAKFPPKPLPPPLPPAEADDGDMHMRDSEDVAADTTDEAVEATAATATTAAAAAADATAADVDDASAAAVISAASVNDATPADDAASDSTTDATTAAATGAPTDTDAAAANSSSPEPKVALPASRPSRVAANAATHRMQFGAMSERTKQKLTKLM